MAKRLITKRQEQALRLCHYDFEGLSQEKAAEQMGISQSAVNKLLAAVKKKLPQYFPTIRIFTKQEAEYYHFYMVEGWSVDEIAEHFEVTPNSIYKSLQRVRDKGMFFTEAKGRVLQYDSSMDASVKQQF